MTEDELVGGHHQLSVHEFEQALGDGEGQGSLACCSPWGRKESDMTERLNNNCSQSDYWIREKKMCSLLSVSLGDKQISNYKSCKEL